MEFTERGRWVVGAGVSASVVAGWSSGDRWGPHGTAAALNVTLLTRLPSTLKNGNFYHHLRARIDENRAQIL